MTETNLEKNLPEIKKILRLRHQDVLNKKLEYIELDRHADCFDEFLKWDDFSIIHDLTNILPAIDDNESPVVVAELINKKFMVIHSWDKLVSMLVGHNNAWQRWFAVGTDKIVLDDAYISGLTNLYLFFGTINDPDTTKFTVSLTYFAIKDDFDAQTWADLPILIQAVLSNSNRVCSRQITMKTFSFKLLEDLLNECNV